LERLDSCDRKDIKNMTLVVFGDGSHARVIRNQLKNLGEPLPLFIGATSEAEFLGKLKKGDIEAGGTLEYHIAIGDNEVRKSVSLRIAGFLPAADAILSPTSRLEESASVARGSFIAPMSYIGINALVGSGCILNTGSIIDHDVEIGDYSHLGGNCYVAGQVKIGNQVFLGAGSTIIEGLTIASNVTIGAGAVVVNDIEEPGIYVGVPARLRA